MPSWGEVPVKVPILSSVPPWLKDIAGTWVDIYQSSKQTATTATATTKLSLFREVLKRCRTTGDLIFFFLAPVTSKLFSVTGQRNSIEKPTRRSSEDVPKALGLFGNEIRLCFTDLLLWLAGTQENSPRARPACTLLGFACL